MAVYRIGSLGYAAALALLAGGYDRPAVSWLVIGVMAVWTAGATYAYARLPGRPLLAADLLVTMGCLLASPYAQGARPPGTMPLTATWVAAPVLAWAVYGGRRAGAVAAVLMSAADLWLRGFDEGVPVNGAVLMLLAGVVVGHVARLARQAEARMQRAVEMEAAGRERERLARDIHDSVLQVLALVRRRGLEIGGEAAELGRLAGEQEVKLRELIRSEPAERGPGDAEGDADLGALLRRYASSTVTVATPATPLPLPAATARELVAAVGAALDNVTRHCGEHARAWILADADDDAVTVTVRDDGPGIPPGRLAEAEAEGRLGVSRSIRGRVADLGGTVTVTSTPGQGTEIELSVPAALGRDRASG